jgi:hypothetical protein
MKFTLTLLLSILMSHLTFAQEKKITDVELNKFADAYQQVRMINQSSQQKMMTAVKDENLTIERFNLINKADQNPNKEVKATTEELEKYDAALEAIEEIQENVKAQLQTKIKDAGLSLQRFQQIANMMREDKALQQRLASLMQG